MLTNAPSTTFSCWFQIEQRGSLAEKWPHETIENQNKINSIYRHMHMSKCTPGMLILFLKPSQVGAWGRHTPLEKSVLANLASYRDISCAFWEVLQLLDADFSQARVQGAGKPMTPQLAMFPIANNRVKNLFTRKRKLSPPPPVQL